MVRDNRLDAACDRYVKVYTDKIWIEGTMRKLELPAHNRIIYQLETKTGFYPLEPKNVKEVVVL